LKKVGSIDGVNLDIKRSQLVISQSLPDLADRRIFAMTWWKMEENENLGQMRIQIELVTQIHASRITCMLQVGAITG